MAKYLFVGAHPDDIEFGAGATIAKAVDAGSVLIALLRFMQSYSMHSR